MKAQKEKTLISLKKVQSLTAKIIDMMEKENYCIDVMQQNLAAIGLLKSAHQMMMEDHLHNCFKSAMKTNNEKKKDEMIEEILKVIKIYNK
ncbi:MAG TPA: metal-sensitive transcriptional regulator [Candidatus Pacearchaeota archaeon]|nr:metal-sensitive transcriptional regulator [Candidatus Pacearchaeota archaeon]HPR80014.1 metal-sensitive transcriptional regulator [Candidatus Pacearchaeota archaeon]